jgi:hypothetical protein
MLKAAPVRSGLEEYERQAAELLEGHRSGDPRAIRIIHQKNPRFLDSKIPWQPRNIPESEIQNAAFDLSDARLTIARWYDFQSWAALAGHVEAVSQEGSAVCRFETAVEAVVDGDLESLGPELRKHPELVRERSRRITHFDPPVHGATLLHYIAANGVEGYRQRTPANAVDIARALLEAGAEVDALADLYGGQCTTMSLLVSSCHPAQAGVQVALVDTLVDFGAAVEARGVGKWTSPLRTALAFGYIDAAEALVRRGARVECLAAAAGLGRLDDAARLLPEADAMSRHVSLALAAQMGHAEVVKLLLDAGEDPDRYNPEGNHAHSTPLHQAALAGHEAVVRLLVERGARLDRKDTIYQGTPLDWAIHGGKTLIESYLGKQR